MLELDEIREHLRLDPEDTSDILLNRYQGAAVRRFESRTGRQLFRSKDDVPIPAPANSVVLDDDIALALLLLIGHWEVNREATTDSSLAEIPMGFDELANPYRWWPE